MIARLARATVLAGAALVALGLEGADSPSSHHTATGTLRAYDPGSRALTVASAKGAVVFRVASDARAWLGRKRLPVRQLPSHVGAQVTLAWAEVDGVKTTHTVRLEEPRGGPGR